MFDNMRANIYKRIKRKAETVNHRQTEPSILAIVFESV